ncbi:MAG: hypothetical protein EAZ84_09535 [Verrucomicrobia bacterium]|nr:MAG: hypothetical protein EAZ84_09535 [Verrucomicrobiota bacterium]
MTSRNFIFRMLFPRPHSSIPPWASFFFAAVSVASLPGAQDFTLQLGQSTYEAVDSSLPLESVDAIKGGIAFGVASNVAYDSNFFIAENDPESELTTVVAPWMSYRSDPESSAPLSIVASYAPSLLAYAKHSEFNGIDHSGALEFMWQTHRTSLTAHVDYSERSLADRVAGTFVEGSIFSYGFDGGYQLGPRTRLLSRWDAVMTDYDTGAEGGADAYITELGGLWDASERLSVGPALRYSATDSDTSGDREGIALIMKARYKSRDRLRLASSAGLEFERNSRLGDDWEPSLVGGLSGDYRFADHWILRIGVRYAKVPSPGFSNYQVNDLSFTTGLVRELGQGSLEAGAGFGIADYEAVGTVSATVPKEEYQNYYLTYRCPIFSDRASFDSTIRAVTSEGQRDWSQWQISTGLRIEF